MTATELIIKSLPELQLSELMKIQAETHKQIRNSESSIIEEMKRILSDRTTMSKLKAVKFIKEAKGMYLMEAKRYVDSFIESESK